MKRIFLFTIGLLYATSLFSQFTDSSTHYFNYASTGVMNKTNTARSFVFSNTLKFSIRKKRFSLNSANMWIYGQQQHHLTNNDFSTSLDGNLYTSFSHFYYWGLATYEKSYSLKINNRVQAGLGMAYSFIDKEAVYLNISDGILYEASSLKSSDSTNDVYHTFRNSLRLRHRFALNNIIMLEGTYFWQPSLRDASDYVLKSNTTLSVKLRKWLAITAAVNYNKVNRTRSESLLVTFGLSVEKYF